METLPVVFAALAGATGYLVAKFWMDPLLKYLDIKHQVTSDLVFYANVIVRDGFLNEEGARRWQERRFHNRKHAAEMRAIFFRLPAWYRAYLRCVGEDPVEASMALINLSNCDDYECGEKAEKTLAEALRPTKEFGA